MQENNTNVEEIPEKDLTDGKLFAEAILNAEGELYTTLYKHFADEMNKAVKGRICTPERMALLYPIFREINIEMNEIKTYWDREEMKEARRKAKREAKNAQN
jgi:hypothetical protein